MKKRAAYMSIVLCFFAVLLCLSGSVLCENPEKAQQVNTGMPDAVSSVCKGGDCRLIVVADKEQVQGSREERIQFALEVIDMCRENSFRTIRFSTDVNGWPRSLDIRIYLSRDEIRECEPVMRIEYEPRDAMCTGCDITAPEEEYVLILDGETV